MLAVIVVPRLTSHSRYMPNVQCFVLRRNGCGCSVPLQQSFVQPANLVRCAQHDEFPFDGTSIHLSARGVLCRIIRWQLPLQPVTCDFPLPPLTLCILHSAFSFFPIPRRLAISPKIQSHDGAAASCTAPQLFGRRS